MTRVQNPLEQTDERDEESIKELIEKYNNTMDEYGKQNGDNE